jgi:predicted metal-binding membrane protein
MMLMMVALGIMSVTWMGVIAIIGVAQRLLPASAAIDVPMSLATIGLGVRILAAPSTVPVLTPAM